MPGRSVFISYVREDQRIIEFLCQILKLNGLEVWLDKDDIQPGARWKPTIETAIKSGMYFLSVYSNARQRRSSSYVNEETVVAVDEIRRRPHDKRWFIPVIIDDCDIESRSIGGGEYISDLQICDLRDWGNGLIKLMRSFGVENPIIDLRKPISAGLPSFVKISSGFVRYDEISDAPPLWQGLEHRLETGWCHRNSDGKIVAYVELRSPLKILEDFNAMLGYKGFHCDCEGDTISQDIERPSRFVACRYVTIPSGSKLPDLSSGTLVAIPIELRLMSQFVAEGVVVDMKFSGTFSATVNSVSNPIQFSQASRGVFELNFSPDYRPPELH